MNDTSRPRPTAPTLLDPRDVHRCLAERFNAHDLDGLAAIYDAEATLVPQPGTAVSGARGLREALAAFLSYSPKRTFVETLGVETSADLALTRSRWGLEGTNPTDGAPVTMEHFGIEVMRRQADGSWRFLIDDPFGGDDAAARPEAHVDGPKPSDLHQEMARLFAQGSLEGLVDLYVADGTLIPRPGTRVTGRAAIRGALTDFLALKPRDVRFSTVAVIRAGDVALTRSHWEMTGKSEDGAVALEHHGVEVMRRAGPGGTWLFAIDDPFAGDPTARR